MDLQCLSFNFIADMITDKALTELLYIAFFDLLFHYSLHFLSDQSCLWSGGVRGFFHLHTLSIGVTNAEESDCETIRSFAVNKSLD